jgi:hypothetical protein
MSAVSKKKQSKGATDSPFMARATLAVTLIVGLAGHAATVTAAAIGQEDKNKSTTVVSCPAEIGKAIELRKANPTVEVQYSGELESQCHLNEILKQVG